jgi:hypothetical protein
MPPTSEQLPLLGIYYVITICIVSLSTAMTVVTLNINNKGLRGQEVPKLAKIIFFRYIARFIFINLESMSNKQIIDKRLLKDKINTIVNFENNSNSMNLANDCEDIPLKLDKENNNSLKVICNHKKLKSNDTFIDSKKIYFY